LTGIRRLVGRGPDPLVGLPNGVSVDGGAAWSFGAFMSFGDSAVAVAGGAVGGFDGGAAGGGLDGGAADGGAAGGASEATPDCAGASAGAGSSTGGLSRAVGFGFGRGRGLGRSSSGGMDPLLRLTWG
jgi:hypothetical protein